MKIDVNQVYAEKENKFEIMYDGLMNYVANVPFLTFNGTFGIEKLREIKVFDLNSNLKYMTNYNYIGNKIEEFVPLKYVFTNSQKFNQFSVIDSSGVEQISIYFEMQEIFKGVYIIKKDNKYYTCYPVSDGYVNHISIYDGENQISEILKSNIVTNGNDKYRIYLKNEFAFLADGLAMLALYLDRVSYNSSYIKNKSQTITYQKTYSKVNKYYDPNWVKNNFDASDFFESVENQANEVKQKIKNQVKKVLIPIAIFWIIMIIFFIILIIFLF